MITATYSTSYESTVVNTGEPAMDVKESESRERKNLEYSDALTGSQIGHSTLSRGKLCTWGRAVGSEESEYQRPLSNA
jgi:hypothetical protein